MDVSQSAAPVKLTNRQELFAQAVAAGKAASPAYREVYGVSVSQSESNGPRLMGNDRVKRRIAQIMADNAAAASVSVQSLTKMLITVYDLAVVTKQASAAAQAVMGIGKLHGLLVDKTQLDAVVRKPAGSPEAEDEMSEDAWMKTFASSSSSSPNQSPNSNSDPDAPLN